MFELFGTMAPIPELAGRRVAPPIDLSQSRALFGRKENKSRRIFIFANTFLRKTPLAIFFTPPDRELCPNSLRNFRILLLYFLLAVCYIICIARKFLMRFFNGRLGADPHRFACKTRAAI